MNSFVFVFSVMRFFFLSQYSYTTSNLSSANVNVERWEDVLTASFTNSAQTLSGSGAMEEVRIRPPRSRLPLRTEIDVVSEPASWPPESPTAAARSCLEELALDEDSWLERRLPADLTKSHLKGTVSRYLRWVLLYINRKLFSRAIVAHHFNFNIIKGTLYNLKKKIQRQNGSANLDGLHNSRCGSFRCVRRSRWRHYLHG